MNHGQKKQPGSFHITIYVKKESGFFTNRNKDRSCPDVLIKNFLGFFTICENLLPIFVCHVQRFSLLASAINFSQIVKNQVWFFRDCWKGSRGFFWSCWWSHGLGYCQKKLPRLLHTTIYVENSREFSTNSRPCWNSQNLPEKPRHRFPLFVENPSRFFTCYTAWFWGGFQVVVLHKFWKTEQFFHCSAVVATTGFFHYQRSSGRTESWACVLVRVS